MKGSFFLCLMVLLCLAHPGFSQADKKTAAKKKSSKPAKTPKTPLDKKIDSYVEKLRKEKFTVLKSKKDIPDFIKAQMPGFNDLSLADPDEKYQEPDVIPVDSTLPGRKVVFLAKSKDLFVIAYIKGGAKSGDHLALVQYKDGRAIDVLPRVGCHDCKSIKAIIHFINVDREIRKEN